MKNHQETTWIVITSFLMVVFVGIGLHVLHGRGTLSGSNLEGGGPFVFDKDMMIAANAAQGDHITMSVDIKNVGSENISIIGCAVGCFGIPKNSMPFTIPAGNHQLFNLDVLVPSRAGQLESELVFYTDVVKQPSIKLPIKLSVLERGADQ